MYPVKRFFEYVILFSLLAMFGGCATEAASQSSQRENDYYPKLPPNIKTIEEATADLTVLLKENEIFFNSGKNDIGTCNAMSQDLYSSYPGVLRAGRWEKDNTCYYYANRIDVTPDRIDFPLFPLFYEELSDFKIIVSEGYLIRLPKGRSVNFRIADYKETAHRMADDLFFIQQVIDKRNEGKLAAFIEMVNQRRGLKIKPTISEEQRKFIVQANAFTQQKDYAEAINRYNKVIAIDPISYPAAYFNIALLHAQERRFKLAIECMKKYLLLEPEAKDARSAQDKIYEWEAMLDK